MARTSVVYALATHGPGTFQDLVEKTGLPELHVMRALKEMVRTGKVLQRGRLFLRSRA